MPEDKPREPGECLSFPNLSSTSYVDPLGGTSLSASLTVLPMETPTHVYEFLARLRQPFGALLLTPTRWNVAEYRRVASGSLITVQIEDITSEMLDRLMRCVRLLDVL